jgi:RNA polymerase sigma factor (sigma-70 family)
MASWVALSDEQLLISAREDADAFSAFYRRYERPVLMFFRRRVSDSELAADLTAEVFAAVLAALPRYRPDRTPVAAWLFAIARHKLANSRRRGQVEASARDRLAMGPVVLDDEDLKRIDGLGSGDVFELLDGLPEAQRHVVQAHIVDERSYAEIAGELRCSEAVVRKRVSRGLATLRDQLRKGSA